MEAETEKVRRSGGPGRSWVRPLVVTGVAALIGACALVALVMAPFLRQEDVNAGRFASMARAGGPPPVLWELPSFARMDQRGDEVSLASLRGKPFIADFIFTECTSACPMITSRMVKLQRSLSDRDMRFVSFSVDPEHDTVAALLAYFKRWNPTEERWSLLTNDASSLEAITKGFRVIAKPTGDVVEPILHSEYFFLVDGEGKVRGVYSSSDAEATDRLVADARQLATSNARPPAQHGSYATLGCAGCHEDARVAPPLVNLIGAERTLSDGAKVTIDAAYLRRAILEPGAEVVAGFMPLMPSYVGQLSDTELTALVDDLSSRTSTDAPAQAAEAKLVTDPVCKMRIRATADTLHLTHQGKEVYFCSSSCRDHYQADPSRYPLD